MTATTWWWVTLGLGVVVTAVVAVLLVLIYRSALRIRDTVAEIWVAGPAIAAQTAHLAILRRVNLTAGEILATAGEIGGNAGRIQEHAEGCSGCPYCVIGWGNAGAT
ncbi:hypothetical protein BH20GEM2_BH20GEM2_03760 [soil metagenome]